MTPPGILSEAYDPPAWATPKKSKSVTSQGTKIGSKGDPEFEKKHPRGKEGSSEGGKFIKKGSSGSEVRGAQRKLGVSTTGTFNEATRRAVIAFQKKHGLVVDGIIGRQTAAAMLGNKNASSLATGKLGDKQARKLSSRGQRSRESEAAFEPGLLAVTEETVDVEKRTRDDGTVTATYERVRSALWDLERDSSKTTVVRLPHGVAVTSKKLPPSTERPYLRRYEFTVRAPDGRTHKCHDTSEAAEYAKDWDVEAASAAKSATAAA